jgi:predicted nucleic acid-binding protein
MTAVFVDAGILICSEDGRDAARQARAIDWLKVLWDRRLGRISTQVMSEFYVDVTRKARVPMDRGDARAEVRRYQRWQPWLVDHATTETAWSIESRFGFNYWDALIVAAAQAQGCGYLLSEGLPHDQLVDSVRILDPFRVGPEILDGSPPTSNTP